MNQDDNNGMKYSMTGTQIEAKYCEPCGLRRHHYSPADCLRGLYEMYMGEYLKSHPEVGRVLQEGIEAIEKNLKEVSTNFPKRS